MAENLPEVVDGTGTAHRFDNIPMPVIRDMNDLALSMFMSKSFKDIHSPQAALVKILAGRAFGLDPVTSMSGIYIVNGVATCMAKIIAGLIKKSGRYDYDIVELTDQKCTIEFFRRNQQVESPATVVGNLMKLKELSDSGFITPEQMEIQKQRILDSTKQWFSLGTSTFTMADALKAGLGGKQLYKSYPRNMLFGRALTNGARWYCPDCFTIAPYTPEEMGLDVVDAEFAVSEKDVKREVQND